MQPSGWLQARFSEMRPRALAGLNRWFRDLEFAEEALAIACEKAVVAWARSGEPDDPLAWLMTTARNAGIDILRREQRRSRLLSTVVELEPDDRIEDTYVDQLDGGALSDDVLRLLFVCCHSKLTPQDQTALALRVVAGLSVEEVAKALLVRVPALEKRLVRARSQIATAQIPFETPTADERRHRLRTVSLMIYLMFSEGWSATTGPVQVNVPLCEEAIRLARLLLRMFPTDVELQGLLSLVLFHYSRRNGRVAADGRLLTLDEQERSLWDREMIAEATSLLEKALRHGRPDSYQIQAAIAATHAQARTAEGTDWHEIERLYLVLLTIEPTPIVHLNHAAATARTRGADAGLAALEPVARELDNYRWFHSTRAGLLLELGRRGEAKASLLRALELNPTAGERQALLAKMALCKEDRTECPDRAFWRVLVACGPKMSTSAFCRPQL